MKILFITSSHNGLSQHAWCELIEKKHQIKIHIATTEEAMIAAVNSFQPKLIIAPFLKKAIPAIIWKNYTCLIVHPGIKGDRGPSALDWAIMRQEKEWGVTILQADKMMDAGPIWASHNFPMREITKSSLYRHEVTTAALKGILEAVAKFESNDFIPETLDYSNTETKGQWNDPIKRTDREVDWHSTSKEIWTKIRAADSHPGLWEGAIFPFPCFMYGAHIEGTLVGKPGAIIAQKNKALCIGTADGALWVSHLKKDQPGQLKRPAMEVLSGHIPTPKMEKSSCLLKKPMVTTFQDIYFYEKEQVGYLHFDLYNGTMNTEQCTRLRTAFWHLQTNPDIRVIVLMGGQDLWANGIDLNAIENANDPAQESWNNIIALNDLIHDIIQCTTHYVIAAMHGNAGAGSVILALAADEVIAREGIVLNPHYKNMGLYGSEYWTYLLPKKVGAEMAQKLTTEALPITSKKAHSIGLIDTIAGHDIDALKQCIAAKVSTLTASDEWPKILKHKKKKRLQEEASKPLITNRNEELQQMWKNFYSSKSAYHSLRYAFVHKLKA